MNSVITYFGLPRAALIGLLLSCGLAFSSAQSTFVVPAGNQNVEGDLGLAIGMARVPDEYFIRPTGFPALPEQALYLTGLSFRGDVSPNGFAGGHRDFSQWDIALSTNPQAVPGHLFIPGADRVSVYTGGASFDIPDAGGPGPAPFSMGVTFQQPFLYKIGSPLLIEFNARQAGLGVVVDWSSDTACCTTLAEAPEPGGFQQIGAIPVMQFSFVVPEAAPGCIALLGLGLFLSFGRRAHRVNA